MIEHFVAKNLGLALLLIAAAACGDDDADNAVVEETAPVAVAPAAPVATPGAPAAEAVFLDPNTATREQLLAVPGVTAPVADALVAGRPYATMIDVDRVLAAQMGEAERDAVYARVWRSLDLNTATGEEILLIPGVGARMRHEVEEYRPYRGIEQFRREIGKYVDDAEVARLEQYVEIR